MYLPKIINHQSLWIINFKKLMQAELCIIMIKSLPFQCVWRFKKDNISIIIERIPYESHAVHVNIIFYGFEAGNG